MQRLMSAGLIAIIGGFGWMVYKGLHLEDIKQLVVRSGTAAQTTLNPGGGFQPAAPATTQPPPPAPAPAPAGGATIKIASFNIQVFGDSKASKPLVMQKLAYIIGQFDVVAIQEIRTQDDDFVRKFVTQINQMSGKRYDFRVGPRLGNTRSTEQYAYIFDTAKIRIHPNHIYTISDPDNLLHREPMVAMFATNVPQNYFSFILVNIHTDPDVAGEEMDALAQVYEVVRRHSMTIGGEDDIIVLGDLNTNVPSVKSNGFGNSGRPLQASDLHGLGKIPGIYPVIQNRPTNAVGTKLHDNILFHGPSTREFTGKAGVYDIAALHGDSIDQVKEISDHLPVWAEFSAHEYNGNLASGGAAPVR